MILQCSAGFMPYCSTLANSGESLKGTNGKPSKHLLTARVAAAQVTQKGLLKYAVQSNISETGRMLLIFF